MCDGQTGYTTKKLDAIIEKIVQNIFDSLSDNPKDELINKRYEGIIEDRQANLARAQTELKACVAEVAEYETEVIKVIRGTSQLSADLINKLHNEAKQKADVAQKKVERCEQDLLESQKLLEKLNQQYDDLMTWSEMFLDSPIDTKKMIVSHVIKAVKVSRDYAIDVDLNISCEQFGLTM